MSAIGDYVKLYDSDGYILVQAHEEPRIDAAVSRYIDSGRNHDTLLALDCMDGCVYKCLASNIASWYVSTPENRRASLEWEQAAKEETDEVKQDLGIWEEG